MKFILASKSPRRKEILNKINFKFKIVPSTIDESQVSTKMNPIDYCTKLAELKAQDVSSQYHDYTVIGADTIVVIKNTILNKPNNYNEAFDMLKTLSNNTHEVITGVALKNRFLNINYRFHDITNVTFYKLSNNDISEYINNYNPLDKSGSYGIQDGSALYVKEIKGSYDNIVGFPISKFHQILKKDKYI